MVDDSPRLNAWITSELIVLVLLTFLFLFLIMAGREHSFVSWKAILSYKRTASCPWRVWRITLYAKIKRTCRRCWLPSLLLSFLIRLSMFQCPSQLSLTSLLILRPQEVVRLPWHGSLTHKLWIQWFLKKKKLLNVQGIKITDWQFPIVCFVIVIIYIFEHNVLVGVI